VETLSDHITHPAENSTFSTLCFCTAASACFAVAFKYLVYSPRMAIDSADSGVTASMLSVGCGSRFFVVLLSNLFSYLVHTIRVSIPEKASGLSE
jgi:riboflavin transporter FmnP